MKKFLLALVLVLALCVPSFATSPSGGTTNNYYDQSTTNQGGQGGAGGSAIIQKGAVENNIDNKNTNTNLNTNVNTNRVDVDIKNSNKQDQSQKQGQSQSNTNMTTNTNNNGQTISPSQSINIETPRALLGATSGTAGTELNYFSGGQRDVTGKFPKFITKKVNALSSNDVIYRVFSVTANVKFKNLYQIVINDITAALKDRWPTDRLRYQIVESDAMKSWNTGGNISGAGSALTGPTSGTAGSVGIIPAWGGSKVQNLYTVVIVIVRY